MTNTLTARYRAPRTKIADRSLPDYTHGEEVFNMVTHIVGAVFGLVALVLCVIKAAMGGNVWGIVSGAIYGASMIMVYTISSVYHGISPIKAEHGKKVMQVVDHCDIYGLIAGSYAPIVMTGLRVYNPVIAWSIFGSVLFCCAIGIVFTAIDFKKYSFISNFAYFGSGWSLILSMGHIIKAFPAAFIFWLIGGGVIYTSGMIFYALGNKKRYCHSIFHLFILGGSVLQFVAIILYCM